MKNFKNFFGVIFLLSTLLTLVLVSCPTPNSTTTTVAQDLTPVIQGNMNLGSSSESKIASWVAVLQEPTRAVDTLYKLDSNKSKIVYDDLIFVLSGTYDTKTKELVGSASGKVIGVSIKFSISCSYDQSSKQVSNGAASLVINDGTTLKTYNGALTGQETTATDLVKVKNFFGYYYHGKDDKDDFNDADLNAMKVKNETGGWGKYSIQINPDNTVKGTAWAALWDPTWGPGRWYFSGGKYDPDTKVITGLWFDGATAPKEIDKTKSDFTLKVSEDANGKLILKGVLKEFFTNSNSTEYYKYNLLEYDSDTKKLADEDTAPKFPLAGNWEWVVEGMKNSVKVVVTETTFFTKIYSDNNELHETMHSVIVKFDTSKKEFIVKAVSHTKTDGSIPEGSGEGCYLKVKYGETSEQNKYTFKETMWQQSQNFGYPKKDMMDLSFVDNIDIDSAGSDKLSTGYFIVTK